MKYCRNCGTEIDDRSVICPSCGVPQEDQSQATVVDNGGIGWGLLGCCIPIVGLVLFLVWKDSKPKSSKAAGIGALVAVGIYIAFYILLFAIGVGAARSGYYY